MRTDDGYIVQECLNGKSEAFGILVDKYKAGIYAFVCAEVRNFQDAEDVTQEVFLKAYQNLRGLRRWESFGFWLYRIARNQCKKWVRSQSRRPDNSLIEDQDPKVAEKPSLDAYRVGQVDESLWEGLDSLSEIYREVLVLHYFGGMTIKNIARAIGASPTAIGMRFSRARTQLKEEMIAMMDTAFEGQRLQASFTFRIVEAVKRIKIQPMPRATGLPWGLSLAAGIMIAAMTLGSQMVIHELPRPLVFPGEMNVSEVREMSVDILRAPGTSVISGKQGDIDGGGIDQRNPQNTFLPAPTMGGDAWTQKADMPTGRYISGSAVVDGKIYVIGGAPVDFGETPVVEEYDPATDTWTRRADMPTARQGVVAAAVDGIIYVIGGFGDGVPGPPWVGSSIVYAYDPATDEWTRKADMPTARFTIGAAACVLDGRIYVSGGCVEWTDEWPCVPTVEVYDPATDTWTQASDMPWPKYGHSASVVDGKMYIVGGVDNAVTRLFDEGKIDMDELLDLLSTIHVYDPATDTWTTAEVPPTTRMRHTAAVVDGKIYIIGGPWGPILSTVYEYTPGLPDNISSVSPKRKVLTTWGEVKSE